MIKNRLLFILEQSKSKNKLFTRTLLKEPLQDYILNFVYNDSDYKKLIFTGGTCLRKIYGLPRLSEDLDFDFSAKFEIEEFASRVKEYFQKTLQYRDLSTKISNNKRTVLLKFPKLLGELDLAKTEIESTVLFIRCDFSQEKIGRFQTEVNSIATPDFSFFVLSYDLATLFSNKIIAFLQRDFFKGREQKISFKGRDLFDLVWFFEQTARVKLEPNWPRLLTGLKLKNKKEALDLLTKKVKKIKPKEAYQDLLPYLDSLAATESFAKNFQKVIESKKELLLTKSF